MKTSELLIPTKKEAPADAELASHKLMIRAGMISKLAAGLYSYLPLGLRSLRKIEQIIRSEMDKSGAQELLMPVAQPAEIWQESGRWSQYGKELLRFQDRHGRDFCLAPTHEEVITNLAAQYLRSYKQLPVNFYQIQTKFRDEIRPRFGILRAREFLMKDAYSFHLDEKSLKDGYRIMYKTYENIFTRLGLEFRSVVADSGAIGGDHSHEFHVLADSGEDVIVFSDASDYAANIECAETLPQPDPKPPTKNLEKIKTPNKKTVDEVVEFLSASANKIIKTLLVCAKDGGVVALALRGDHTLNPLKAEKLPEVAKPLEMADAQTIEKTIGAAAGYVGVIGLEVPLVVDYAAAAVSDFICGANENEMHITGVNWSRDVGKITTADLRMVSDGDPSPDGNGKLVVKRGIEVGHIFQLGTKYSKAMGANIIGADGKAITMTMGCYGIGVSRILAAAIEQNFDERGIIFPSAIAPFQIIIVPLNYHKSTRVREQADTLYQRLGEKYETLLDNRRERAGVMFADSELLGIPHRIVLSDTQVDQKTVEYKARNHAEKQTVKLDDLDNFLAKKMMPI